jgi:histidine triad (HIT) family protein
MTTAARGCTFCAIVAGDKPATIVWRDDHTLAFLDARPLFKGHVLVVPRDHVETLADVTDAQLTPLFVSVRRLARAVEVSLRADGSFVAMNNKVSQSVPHLHVHVVPRRRKDGLRGFFWPREPYASEAEMAEIAQRIRDALGAGL